jgi:hypothetical protein
VAVQPIKIHHVLLQLGVLAGEHSTSQHYYPAPCRMCEQQFEAVTTHQTGGTEKQGRAGFHARSAALSA